MSSSRPANPRHTASPGEAASRIGVRLDQRYEVLEQLGRGGSSLVYRVRDVSRNQPLALKQLILHGAGKDRDLRALFEREYHVLAQLTHPGVIRVQDFGIEDMGPYYTMELLEHGDLTACERWPVAQACALAMQVCSALSLLHSRRLVHRDISPRNVRCTHDGSAKPIDFGAMVPMGPCTQVIGTPGFVAPEVVHQQLLDARTDLFSVGATLYFALTGSRPFAARTLAELVDLWRHEPLPPSRLAPGIPNALDALILSLLCVDPARRPASAFEVMQRLAAICGAPVPDSAVVASAYLTKPPLVARETQQRVFRQCLARAIRGEGCGLLFHGPSGMGRSRLLDACLLDAKTSGATVLQLFGRALQPAAFAGAFELMAQLLDALPELATRCASESDVWPHLFQADAANPSQPLREQLRALSGVGEDSYAVQEALQTLFRRVARNRPLLIAVDDAERVDQASLALLAALVHEPAGARLIVACTALQPIDRERHAALAMLQTLSTEAALTPFAARDVDALFGSVFFGAPHTSLVSDRIYKVAAGNPRAALRLAMHLVERDLIRYAHGNWILPAELAVSELPADSDAARELLLAQLGELPRFLCECQAVALEGPWSQADYRTLAASVATPAQVDAARAMLLQKGILVEAAGAYTISQLAVRRSLLAQLTAAQRTQRELAVAELCVSAERPGLTEVYHRFQAHDFERGLPRLSSILAGAATITQLYRQSGIALNTIADILVKAHALAVERAHKPREIHELSRLLLELSVTTDTTLYHRYAAAYLARLEQDSGLMDYRADASTPTPERLQRALQAAMARYAATPEAERVYRLDEAIKHLAHHVAVAIVISTRVLDSKLFASLPGLLEPFSSLSPLLHALWQNALLAHEMTCNGQFEQGHARAVEVHESLATVSAKEVPYVDALRGAIAHAAAYAEVSLGYPSAEHWLAILDAENLQRLSAKQLRRALHLYDGDAEAAQHCKREADVLAVQAHFRQMFEPALFDLHVQQHTGDLAGVKHTADRIAQLAARWPGWRGAQHVAQATFQRMRGDLQAAKVEYERALEATDTEAGDQPAVLRAWVAAAAGYTAVLTELGEFAHAREFGLCASERCDRLCISSESDAVERALALAEAKLGDHTGASARMDRLIAKRSHLRPSRAVVDVEARALLAIVARDASTAAHFARLASSMASNEAHRRALRARLVDAAQHVGIRLMLDAAGPDADESEASIPTGLVADDVLASLSGLADPAARADRLLELLAHALGASAGHLYFVRGTRLERVSSRQTTPDRELDRFANEYFEQWIEQAAMTSIFTDVVDATDSQLASWLSDAGIEYRLALMNGKHAGTCLGLVALSDATARVATAEYRALVATLGVRLLELGDAQSRNAR